MTHWTQTDEVKDAARKHRRAADREAVGEGLDDYSAQVRDERAVEARSQSDADGRSRRLLAQAPRPQVGASFFGIVIQMFYREHGTPHFRAEYQGERATFTFDGELLAGSIASRTAKRLVREWALAHAPDLDANWHRA